MTEIWIHPFKQGVYDLLRRHFSDKVVKNFSLIFEKEMFNPKEDKNLWKQLKNNNLVMEVYYKTGYEISEYICDLYGWESKARTEYRLLKYITDKVKAGKIGKDWIQEGDKLGISKDVLSGKFETKGGDSK